MAKKTEPVRPTCVLAHRWVLTTIFAPKGDGESSPEEYTCQMCGAAHMITNGNGYRYLYETGRIVRG